MPRPPLPRRIGCRFNGRGFRPIGRSGCARPVVAIGLDALEAIRLVDRELLYQDAAAERMGVSRPTFARILAQARQAVAECLLENKILLVQPAATVAGPAEGPGCPIHDEARRRGRGCRCAAARGHRPDQPRLSSKTP